MHVKIRELCRVYITYRKFLRRMIPGSFAFVNQAENDYCFVISNAQLHRIRGTSDVSYFIRSQQHHYASHVSLDRSLKKLIFNDDHYIRRGRPIRSMLEQVIDIRNTTVNQYCSLALSKKK